MEPSALDASTPRPTTTEADTAPAKSLGDVRHPSTQIYESEGDLGGSSPAVATSSLADTVLHQGHANGAADTRTPGHAGDYANTTRRPGHAVRQRLGADHPDFCYADGGRCKSSRPKSLTKSYATRYATSVAAGAFRADQASKAFQAA
ncbi:gamma-aminobutyric acid receptor subunit theta [Lasius niger]|uniref:Gamma-aminobutyric acid receptor subunit theta n=1 Tax=Lasius niger TaxID=67767 RepID=A0A0J7KCS8_LASNI|nr:gamma-aminobutyric acid receptor subunit theta [Lasius niger]